MSTRPLTLLLLSGAGHTGDNVMAALAGRRAGLRLITTSDRPDEPALFAFDAVYLAPVLSKDAPGFEQRVLQIIEREDVDLVIPCRDEDVQWLSALCERRVDLRPKLMCGSPRAAEIANDKWLSYELAMEHGLPFAATLRCDPQSDWSGFVAMRGLPLVAKPRRGAGSAGVRLLVSREQVAGAISWPDYVVQEFLGDPQGVMSYLDDVNRGGIPLVHTFQGAGQSSIAVLGPDHRLVSANGMRYRITGRMTQSKGINRGVELGGITERCAHVFAALGWRGPLNMQCLPRADGALRIHEFNVRFNGGMASRWLVGCDDVGAAIRAFTGIDIGGALSYGEPPTDAFETLHSRVADGRHVRSLAQHGEWFRERDARG